MDPARRLQAVYYRDPGGGEPVRSFLHELDSGARAAIGRQISRVNLLSNEVPHLPFPHSSQVAGELRELRCHYGRRQYRILYRRSGQLVILLHAFAKRSAGLSERDIETARRRWADFKHRMDAGTRTAPRAVGRDAP